MRLEHLILFRLNLVLVFQGQQQGEIITTISSYGVAHLSLVISFKDTKAVFVDNLKLQLTLRHKVLSLICFGF